MAFGAEKTFPELLGRLYSEGLSCNEISELILQKSGQTITARSVERNLRKFGYPVRKISEAFPLAVSRGRVKWAWRELKKKSGVNRTQLSKKLRFEVFQRDGFRCVLCGATPETTVLEVDHIIPRIHGGKNELGNLRVLCHECNCGKRDVFEVEQAGGFVSGAI